MSREICAPIFSALLKSQSRHNVRRKINRSPALSKFIDFFVTREDAGRRPNDGVLRERPNRNGKSVEDRILRNNRSSVSGDMKRIKPSHRDNLQRQEPGSVGKDIKFDTVCSTSATREFHIPAKEKSAVAKRITKTGNPDLNSGGNRKGPNKSVSGDSSKKRVPSISRTVGNNSSFKSEAGDQSHLVGINGYSLSVKNHSRHMGLAGFFQAAHPSVVAWSTDRPRLHLKTIIRPVLNNSSSGISLSECI